MNTTKYSLVTGSILCLLVATPAFALNMGLGAAAAAARTPTTTVKATAAERLEARIATAKERADQEIERRVATLHEYNTKVQSMVRLSTNDKASLEKFIQDQLSSLSALKTKIATDSDLDTLKADIQSITQSHRVYLLVMPQAHITVASDKILSAGERLSALEVKLAARIAEKITSGTDVSALIEFDADIKAKIAKANMEAAEATSASLALTPDDGDQSKATANKKVLQDSREKIKSAMMALHDARRNANEMMDILKGNATQAPAATTSVVQ